MDKILSYINLISLSLSTATVYNGMAPYANFHCKEILVQDSVIIRVNGTVTLIETDTKKYTMDLSNGFSTDFLPRLSVNEPSCIESCLIIEIQLEMYRIMFWRANQ